MKNSFEEYLLTPPRSHYEFKSDDSLMINYFNLEIKSDQSFLSKRSSFNEKILVCAPHTDDMEFGCGGTIKMLSETDAEISLLVFLLVNKVCQNFQYRI